MFKRFIFVLILMSLLLPVNAGLYEENQIQSRIDSVAVNLLNRNKIRYRIVFVYNNESKRGRMASDKVLTSRQVIVYDGLYQSVQTDDELAAMLAREIVTAQKTFTGTLRGSVDTLQVGLSSKKFETVADKRAVDYMVNAGYNPLALIIYINKTCPQKRYDTISRHNLTSKRLARIYEYITYKYPEYLNDNSYINNPYYQNFLLTSIENRRKLEKKIQSKSTDEVDYE